MGSNKGMLMTSHKTAALLHMIYLKLYSQNNSLCINTSVGSTNSELNQESYCTVNITTYLTQMYQEMSNP